MGDDDVPVDQGIRRGTRETAIETGLLEHHFSLLAGPPTGPGRLEDFGCRDVPSSPPNPREDVPEGVVPADDQTSDSTGEGMETIGVELFQALPAGRARGFLLPRPSAALVPAAVVLPPKAERDAEPEARAHPEFQVGEPSGR